MQACVQTLEIVKPLDQRARVYFCAFYLDYVGGTGDFLLYAQKLDLYKDFKRVAL